MLSPILQSKITEKSNSSDGKIYIPPIYNPQGDDSLENRSIWNGTTTNLKVLNQVRYKWAFDLFTTMYNNTWFPQKVDLSKDITTINRLTKQELFAYKHIISYLTFLDSIQSTNLPKLAEPLTAPEVESAFKKQTEQELLHNWSYQVLLETLFDAKNRGEIYGLWRDKSIMKERCGIISELYQRYDDSKSEEDYFIALYADYLLEGLFFISGFYFFYNLNDRGLMTGTADMIKYIHRDEKVHIVVMLNTLLEAKKTFPYSEERLYEITDQAVQQELRLCNYLFDNNITGISDRTSQMFLQYLADIRLQQFGLQPLYQQKENPYKYLEGKNLMANYFESTVTSYKMASAIKGWDQLREWRPSDAPQAA